VKALRIAQVVALVLIAVYVLLFHNANPETVAMPLLPSMPPALLLALVAAAGVVRRLAAGRVRVWRLQRKLATAEADRQALALELDRARRAEPSDPVIPDRHPTGRTARRRPHRLPVKPTVDAPAAGPGTPPSTAHRVAWRVRPPAPPAPSRASRPPSSVHPQLAAVLWARGWRDDVASASTHRSPSPRSPTSAPPPTASSTPSSAAAASASTATTTPTASPAPRC
jgi:uncharacterized integral membrane protein